MSNGIVRAARSFPCDKCPLAGHETFRKPSKAEIGFISSFKKGELSVDKGATVLAEGTRNPHIYTVLQGWGFRYKLLDDGRRQIVNFAFPGDMLGLQGSLLGEMQHSVEALSPMLLCVFERGELMALYKAHPDLGYDVTWIAARQECILDENLLSVGRRNATERLAYLAALIATRGREVDLFNGQTIDIPITQQHVADTLGLSLVHTNKTVRRLANQKLLSWSERGCRVHDLDGVKALSGWSEDGQNRRPYI